MSSEAREWLPTSYPDYRRIPAEQLREFTRVDPLGSWLAIGFDIAVIAAAVALSVMVLPAWTYPLAVVVIGARQQGLIVLIHEASHRKLFRNARLNDVVGEVVLSWPFFISMYSYRANHFAHHRHLNTEYDPDWTRYLGPAAEGRRDWRYGRSHREVIVPLLKDLVGLGTLGQLKRVVRLAKPRNHDPRRLGEELEGPA